jgi:hypothetical protein
MKKLLFTLILIGLACVVQAADTKDTPKTAAASDKSCCQASCCSSTCSSGNSVSKPLQSPKAADQSRK